MALQFMRFTLDFQLMVGGIEAGVRLCARADPALDSLSPSLSLPPPLMLSLSLSLSLSKYKLKRIKISSTFIFHISISLLLN